jgi:hypothetical protein
MGLRSVAGGSCSFFCCIAMVGALQHIQQITPPILAASGRPHFYGRGLKNNQACKGV